MSLGELFVSTISELRKLRCEYAVGGGLAADLYRSQVRGTGDIDFLFFTDGLESKKGRELLEKLGLTAKETTIFDLKHAPGMNKKSADVFILVGRRGKEEEGVDLLLPPFPWFKPAIRRAQSSHFDFGHGTGPVPTLTAEDVILAKLFAGRLKDKDDINSIFESHADQDSNVRLDLNYLIEQMQKLDLPMPQENIEAAPIALRVFAKQMKIPRKPFPEQ
jgi:hypothetical protein